MRLSHNGIFLVIFIESVVLDVAQVLRTVVLGLLHQFIELHSFLFVGVQHLHGFGQFEVRLLFPF